METNKFYKIVKTKSTGHGFFSRIMRTLFLMCFTLSCLGSSGAFLFHHNRLLALQNSTGTAQCSLEKKHKAVLIQVCKCSQVHFVLKNTHHTQVLPVFVLAYDVPQATEGGTRVLVDSDLLVGGGRFVLTC